MNNIYPGMIVTHKLTELVKIVDYDSEPSKRMNYADAQAAVKKAGCRMLTADEWLNMPLEEAKKYYSTTPFWVEGGLVARRGDFWLFDFFRRFVYAYGRRGVRLGVLAVKGKPAKCKHEWTCNKCGVEKTKVIA